MILKKLIFDSLLERGEKDYIPWLAEKWYISKDGKKYTFKIRENVKWQDGKAMTAEDIKFSFEYFAEHSSVTDYLAIGKNNYIDKIEVIDKCNIKIIVKKTNATLLERFGTSRIIPQHIWKDVKDPKKFTDPKSVIRCGPYKLTDYNEEQRLRKF